MGREGNIRQTAEAGVSGQRFLTENIEADRDLFFRGHAQEGCFIDYRTATDVDKDAT